MRTTSVEGCVGVTGDGGMGGGAPRVMLDALLRGLTLRGEPPAWGGGAAASEDVGGDGRVNSLPSFRMGEKRADIGEIWPARADIAMERDVRVIG